MMGTFGGALEARQIDASGVKLTAEVTGEVLEKGRSIEKLPLASESLKNRKATARNGSQEDRTPCQRRSSCLCFQIVGVETDLLLPDDQRDRGYLPRQGQVRHRGLPSLCQ